MELRQLRYFVKVAELKSFSDAAKELYITQSTLSQQVRQLENELGVELLIRDSRHVSLTDVGAVFLPAARNTLHVANESIERIHDVQDLVTGDLNIGTTFTFSLLLKETVRAYMKRYPGVRLNIVCHPVTELMAKLERHEIDVALSYRPSDSQFANIDSHIMFDNGLCVVVSDTHPLATRKSLRLIDVEPYAVALPAVGIQARSTFDRVVARRGGKFDIRLQINEITVLLDLIAGTQLVTFLSRATVTRQPGLVAIPLDEPDCEMEGCYHVLKNAYLKHTATRFLQVLSEHKALGMAKMDIY